MPTPTVMPTATASATPTPAPTPTPSAVAIKALWGIYGSTVVEFNASQISSGTVNPIHQFSIADPNYPLLYGMTFDRAGDLWIVEGNLNINSSTNNYTGRILEYSVAELAALGGVPNPSPITTLTLGGAGYGLAFDGAGNLWTSVVAVEKGGQLEKFSPSQYAVSGTPIASITIGAAQNPGGLEFGSDGTLWSTPTSIFGPSGGIVNGYATSQLATSAASPTPAYVLNANAPSQISSGQLAIIETPDQVTFDASGDLWSVFNGFAFEYAVGALHGAGTAPTTGFQAYPGESNGGQTEIIPGYAIAFDASSDLVTNSLHNTTSSANVLHYYAGGAYSGTMPASMSATFGSSVPAFDGTQGNVLTAGPYVP